MARTKLSCRHRARAPYLAKSPCPKSQRRQRRPSPTPNRVPSRTCTPPSTISSHIQPPILLLHLHHDTPLPPRPAPPHTRLPDPTVTVSTVSIQPPPRGSAFIASPRLYLSWTASPGGMEMRLEACGPVSGRRCARSRQIPGSSLHGDAVDS